MRIKGLIRAFNQVRARLQTGIRPEEAEPFKRWVHGLVQDVEQICARNALTPLDLPGPSARAYQFLKGLDTDNLPAHRGEQPGGGVTSLRMKRVVSLAEHLADRLWNQLSLLLTSATVREEIRQSIQNWVAAIEGICARNHATAAVLEKPSREVYCWWKFLLSEGNLTLHLDALQRARRGVERCGPWPGQRVLVHLMKIGPLWRKRHDTDTVLVKVHEGFLGAADEVWQAIIHSALLGPDPASKELVRRYARSEEFSEVMFEMESFAEPDMASNQGYAHHLAESFQRVNAAYFGGSMSPPRLVWNRTLTGRKFGHYRASADTVMISVSLDSPTVPDWVLDFVMYHELLHRKHGGARANGRWQVHSAGFRAEERRFARFDDAQAHLERLAGGQSWGSGLELGSSIVSHPGGGATAGGAADRWRRLIR